MFGSTPTGIVILDIVLVLMGMILSPLLWGIFTRLGGIATNLIECVKLLAQTNATLTKVIQELNDAKVRDTALEGRLRGIEKAINGK